AGGIQLLVAFDGAALFAEGRLIVPRGLQQPAQTCRRLVRVTESVNTPVPAGAGDAGLELPFELVGVGLFFGQAAFAAADVLTLIGQPADGALVLQQRRVAGLFACLAVQSACLFQQPRALSFLLSNLPRQPIEARQSIAGERVRK